MSGKPPTGFRYFPDFLDPTEERALVARFDTLDFDEVHMHGVVARRRVLHFGRGYSYDSRTLKEAPPIPDYLHGAQARLAALAEIGAAAFIEVLLTRYDPGAPIGWHRDAPAFGIVAGVSLAAPCVLRMRKETDEGDLFYESKLLPGSAYLITGEARWEWKHHIPPVKALRYSVTFRTARR